MRKVFGLVCAVLFVAGISTVSMAQDLSFGVKAGLNFANLSNEPGAETTSEEWGGGNYYIESNSYSYDMKTGVALGVFAVYKVNDNLSIQPELLYTQKGMEEEWAYTGQLYDASGNPYSWWVPETDSSKWEVKLDYIEIPVLVKYSISPGGDVCPFVFGGPALGILMSAKVDSEDIKKYCNSTDIGLVLGGGVELESGISIDLRYDMGMTKIFKEGDSKSKNTVISLMVGYKL